MNDIEITEMKIKRNALLVEVDDLLNELLQLQDRETEILEHVQAKRHLVAMYNEALITAPRT